MEEIKYRSEEKMKDSGVEWLGKIPKDWNVIRGKYKFKNKKVINRGKMSDVISLTLKGVVDRDKDSNERLQPRDFKSYQEFKKNDLVFKLIDLENINTSRVGIVHKDGLMSPAYIRIIKNESVSEKYYYYLYYSFYIKKIYNDFGNSGVRSSINASVLLNMIILDLNLEEQQKIANFLDIKTSQFDSIISNKEKLIEKLEEAKKSLISEVVTGKVKIVDGEMVERKPEEMKDSGVELLGKIPRDWELKKIGFIFSFKNGVNADSSKYGKGIKFINVKEVIDNETLNYEQIPNKVTISKSSIVENEVKKGDILLNRTSETIEELGLSTIYMDFRKVVFGGFVIRGREKSNDLTLGFKKYILYSYEVRKQIILYSSGSIRKNIAQNALKNVYISFPNHKEQKLISEFLDKKISYINNIIEKNTKQIEKLKEAKQSLISEAVTGKIDLRDWEIKEKETLK